MSKARDLLAEWDKGSSGYSFKLANGQATWVRFMPPYPKKHGAKELKRAGAKLDVNSGILVVHQHGWMPDTVSDNPIRDDGKHRMTNYLCPKITGGRCPFCDFFDRLGKPDGSIRSRHKRKPKMIVDMYVKASGDVKRWFQGKQTLEKLVQLFDIEPLLNHETKGRSVNIRRVGEGFDTQYQFTPSRKRAVAPFDLDECPDIIEALEGWPIATPKQAKESLKIAFGTCTPGKRPKLSKEMST